MTKRAKIILFILLFLAVLIAGVTIAIASVTGSRDLPERRATVTADQGTVEVRAKDSQTWTAVVLPVNVSSGDSVRTGADGHATLDFYDQGVARLDVNTSLTIETLTYDPEHPTLFQSKLFLETGRVWSRLLDFLTPESLYEMHTANTVATIRGTAFSLARQKNVDEVFVSEHAVALGTTDPNAMLAAKEVRAGQFAYADTNPLSNMAAPPPPGTKKYAVIIPPDRIDVVEKARTGTDQNWIDTNRKLDAQYDAQIEDLDSVEAQAIQPVEVNSRWMPLVAWAEKIRLAVTFNPASRTVLADRFAARQLAQDYLTERLPKASPLILNNEVRGLTGRVVTYFGRHHLDGGTKATEPTPPTVTPTVPSTEPPKVETPVAPSLPTAPVVPPKTEQPVTPIAPVVEPKVELPLVPIAPPKPVVYPVSLRVTADNSALTVGGSTPVHAIAIMSDDSQQDVSDAVKWSVSVDPASGASLGAMQGNTFTSNQTAGTTVITAAYFFNDKEYNGTVTITITKPLLRLFKLF